MKLLHLLSAGLVFTLATGGAAAQDVFLTDGSGYGDIAVDDAGNIYATFGSSVSKIDAALRPVWTRNAIEAVSVAVDDFGSVYLGGGGQNTKLRPDGTIERNFAADVRITDMEVFDGSLYTTGLHRESSDLRIARLDLDGEVEWSFSIPLSRESSYWDGYQLAPSISVGSDGRVWVTGYFAGTLDLHPSDPSAGLTSEGANDIFVASYTADGSFVDAFAVGGSGADLAHDIVAHASGAVYVTGFFEGTVDFDPDDGSVAVLDAPACYDAFIAKYDPEGRFLWAVDIGGQEHCTEANGFSLALDGTGGVYLTGYYFDHQGAQVDFDPGIPMAPLEYVGEEDAFLARYDSDGRYRWAFGLGSPYGDLGIGLEIAGDEDVYLMGIMGGAIDLDPGPGSHVVGTNGQTFVARYTSTGGLAIASSVETPLNPDAINVRTYPNPFSERAVFELKLERSSTVSVVVHDALGRVMSRLHNGHLAAGALHRFEIDGEDFANGVYVLRVNGGGFNASRLLLIQK